MQINNFSLNQVGDKKVEKNPPTEQKNGSNRLESLHINNSNLNKLESLEIKTNKGAAIPASISFVSSGKKENLADVLDNIFNAETEEEQFNLLSDTLLKNKGKIDNTPGNRNIVAFRNPNLPTENNKKGVYDDTTFVFWKEKDGTKRVKDFQSNTDPNGLFTDDRPNGDFGRIVAGKTYTFGFSYSNALGKTLRPTDKLNIERFDPKENNFKPAKTSLDVDKTFLFHDGLESTKNTYSMGCQTFPRIYDSKSKTWNSEFNNFWESIRGDDNKNRQKQLFYTVLELPEK